MMKSRLVCLAVYFFCENSGRKLGKSVYAQLFISFLIISSCKCLILHASYSWKCLIILVHSHHIILREAVHCQQYHSCIIILVHSHHIILREAVHCQQYHSCIIILVHSHHIILREAVHCQQYHSCLIILGGVVV